MKPFLHALQGLAYLLRKERNFRIEAIIACLSLALGFYCQLPANQWTIILLCIGAVLSAEALNTAIELLADEVTRDRRPTIKALKDCAAGAVLILAFISALIGSMIFVPHLMSS